MLQKTTTQRVCYADTDKMGFVYHGTFARYYEIGRNEFMRSINLPYSVVESQGILLITKKLNIEYIKPAYYDDLLTIKTTLQTQPSSKLVFETTIYNESNELLNHGEVVLVCSKSSTNQVVRVPNFIVEAIMKHWV